MADNTGIEWTDATWNPIVGCTVVSPGCTNCYAMAMAGRIERMGTAPHYSGTTQASKAGAVWTGKLALAPERILTQPLRWRAPRRIFVNSMGDLFHEDVPDAWIDQVFAVMALSPQHTYQVLTKRAARMRAYLSDPYLYDRISAALGNMLDGPWIWNEGKRWRDRIEHMIEVFLGESADDDGNVVHHDDPMPLPNVWLGVSAEDQRRADERLPELLETPAAVRFVSAEPLLGPIDFEPWLNWKDLNAEVDGKSWGCQGCDDNCYSCPQGKAHYYVEEGPWDDAEGHPEWMTATRVTLDWIIVGGESGQGARPMHPDWPRRIRDQCAAAGTAFFFKQWGEWWPDGQGFGGISNTGHAIASRDGAIERSGVDIPFDRSHEASLGEISLWKVGKARAGRSLDSAEHNAMPEVRHG